jgi:ssDNA thymidine ADP-ribosyltransferase, DarT
MSPLPNNPKIYHITHAENVQKIIAHGALWSDAERLRRGLVCEIVGMSEIKRRRLEEIRVDCHAGTMVGGYVPWYYCPRSVMLYILHMGNSPGLTYNGGQRPIVHLQADLNSVLNWAASNNVRWAFSRGNAGAYYARFSNDRNELANLDWTAIAQTDWRNPDVKEAKQAELLIETSFPWNLIEVIGVIDPGIAGQVNQAIAPAAHKPIVRVERAWYY